MNDVTDVSTFDTASLIFPQSSILYFPIVVRSMYWRHRDGQMVTVDDNKVILRRDETTSKPMQLAVVSRTYKVVHNRELFPAIEKKLASLIEPRYLRSVVVHDEMAFMVATVTAITSSQTCECSSALRRSHSASS